MDKLCHPLVTVLIITAASMSAPITIWKCTQHVQLRSLDSAEQANDVRMRENALDVPDEACTVPRTSDAEHLPSNNCSGSLTVDNKYLCQCTSVTFGFSEHGNATRCRMCAFALRLNTSDGVAFPLVHSRA